MILWLILSHANDDVIKRNYEIKEKEWKMESHTFGLRKEGRKLPPFDPYGQCSKKEERNAKRKEKMGRNEREKGREMRRRNGGKMRQEREKREKQKGRNKKKEKKTWERRKKKYPVASNLIFLVRESLHSL